MLSATGGVLVELLPRPPPAQQQQAEGAGEQGECHHRDPDAGAADPPPAFEAVTGSATFFTLTPARPPQRPRPFVDTIPDALAVPHRLPRHRIPGRGVTVPERPRRDGHIRTPTAASATWPAPATTTVTPWRSTLASACEADEIRAFTGVTSR